MFETHKYVKITGLMMNTFNTKAILIHLQQQGDDMYLVLTGQS